MNLSRTKFLSLLTFLQILSYLLVNNVLQAQQSTLGPTRPSNVSKGIIKDISSLQKGTSKVIDAVPSYLWYRGCGPTSLGMVLGYYDLHGFPDLITGDASTQTNEVNSAIASDQHYNDYSLPLDYSPNLLQDKSNLGGAHASNCLADFMNTSWSSRQNYWGWSWSSDIAPSFVGYVNKINSQYIVTTSYVYYTNPQKWDLYKNEIDNNRPVVLLVDSNGDGATDHFVAGIGYDDNTSQYAIYDTWDNNIHWYQWRDISSAYSWGIYGFDIIKITQPATPTAPVVGTITQPTCAVATGSVVLSGLPATGTWTLTRTPGGTTTTGSGTSTTITGLTAGTYSYTVTNASVCTSPSSANIIINAVPNAPSAPTVGTITQPTCSVATGSVALSGLPATGTWTLTRTPGSVTSTGTGTSATISGLAAGTYIYKVTNESGCTSPSTGNIVINTQPATPTAPVVGTITQPTCAVPMSSVVLSGLPAAGTWTLTRTPGGTTTTGTGTSYTIPGLATGTYTYTVTNSSGCTSGSSGNIVINSNPSAPTAPAVGTITQPTCSVSTGSVVLNGLPASGTWTLTRTPGAVTSTGTGTSTTISGLAAGTYTYTVTDASGCTSGSSGNVIITVQPLASVPTIGTITQPTCSVSTGSVVLNGLPSSGTWTLTRTPGSVTSTGTGTSTTISGLAAGTYTYTVTNASGCTSGSSSSVVINAQPVTPTAPTVGAITQPTCAVPTGSIVLSGLPSTGTWTLTRTPGAVTSTGTGTSTTISGLAAGTYTYTVTDASGCTSGSSGIVVINAQPVTPSSPTIGTITQPTCSVPTGSVALSGLPSSGTWTLTRTPGGTTVTGTGTSKTISDLMAGTYSYTVSDASGCLSSSSSNIVISIQPAVPDQPGSISGSNNPCQGVSQNYRVIAVSGATSYIWTIPSGWSGSSTSETIAVTPGSTGGTISVAANNACGTGSTRTLNAVMASKPTVTTATFSGASASTALGGGNVTSDGGADLTERGVCWSISANPTIANSKTSDGFSTGAFTSTITGLTNGITYHVRAYAINCSGISYGADVTYLHNATGIEEILTNEVSIYPNPVSGLLNIEYKNDNFKTINLLNSQGIRLEKVQVISPRQQIDFSKYEYGIYFLEFVKPDGSAKRMKVINQR